MIRFVILNLIRMQKWCTPVTFRRKHLFMDSWFSVIHFGPPKSGFISKLLFMSFLYDIILDVIIFKNVTCPERNVYLVWHNLLFFCHHNTRKGFKTMTMMRRPQRSIIILSCSIDWLDALGGADNLSLLLIWYTMETINLIASTSSDPLEKYQGFKVPGGKEYNW